MHKKRLPSHDKAAWVCLIATLAFSLWGANSLPIQQLEYQVTTNLAISQHRMPMLQALASKANPTESAQGDLFSKLELEPEEKSRPRSGSSDLRSVRVKLRCPRHCDLREIEKALNELTIPSLESTECVVFNKQLQLERWLLESGTHSIKRIELDLEREKNAIETDQNTENVVQDENPRASSPFQLTAFSAPDPSQPVQLQLLDSLRQLNQTRSQNIESMLLTLDRLKVKARGFVSMTGSPRMVPMVRPLTGFRFFVLCTLVLAVWLLLMGWLLSLRLNTTSIRKTWGNRGASKSRKSLAATASDSIEMEKSLHWMQREGIQYLGSIQVITNETVSDQAGESVLSDAAEVEFDQSSQLQCSGYVYSIQLLKSMSEGSIVLWIGLFAARILFDPVWRELVMVAPLAALSRMISGV
ncbi:MAG: hypothetical protein NTY15_10930 [Planctomycetota bacterium]|nr:hypothetical protein [Planctomycetota bacterium]